MTAEAERLTGSDLQQSRADNKQRLTAAYRTHELVTHAMPNHIWVEPTNACNAHCPLCPTGAGESSRPKAMLELDRFKGVVDQVYPYAESMNLWNIGEPFLNRGIFDMIRYAQDHEIATRVSTNGFVFYDPENIERIIQSGLTNLVVSMDGTTAPVFNQYRVGVDFDKVVKGLELLQEAKQQLGCDSPTVVWQFIAMSHNQHQIPEAQQLASKLGAVFSLKSVNLDMVKQSSDNLAYLPTHEGLRRYDTGKPDVPWILKSDRQNDCGILWRSMMINADGIAVPCCYDYDVDLKLGSFPEQSIGELWDGEAMQSLRRRILTERDQLAPCSKCSVDDRSIIFLDEIPIKRS